MGADFVANAHEFVVFGRALTRSPRTTIPAGSEKRCDEGFLRPLGRRAAAEVGRPAQSKALCNFGQPLSAGCEEPAEEASLAQSLQPSLPGLGAGAQPLEDLGHFP